jgi:DNA repair photolyase
MGTGAFAKPVARDDDYRRGYLCGLVRSDRLMVEQVGARLAGVGWLPHASPVGFECCEDAALQRAAQFLIDSQVDTQRFLSCAGSRLGQPTRGAFTSTYQSMQRARVLIGWPAASQRPARAWQAGFLAGMYDAAGSFSDGAVRILHSDPEVIDRLCAALAEFGFGCRRERDANARAASVNTVRMLGGLSESLRFLHSMDPAVARKRDIAGQSVKSAASLRVVAIEPLGRAMRLFDITTGTEDFIANGVVSHNCYARPSHAYMDLSPGIDFETKIFFKADAARRLEDELARPGYVPKQITLGANTDPYQPLERQLRVTRSVLEVLERTRHPVSIVTKRALILRDLDLLVSLAKHSLVNVFVSLTTLDADLKRTLEPRAASPAARLRVVRELCAAGVPTGVLIAPIIPAVNDSELERIVAAVAAVGAASAGYVLLRLPHELKELFRQWLDEHLPERAEHVMALVRDARGGRENDPRFGTRMVGTGAWAQLLRDRFSLACKRHGIHQRRLPELSGAHFQSPGRGGQMTLPL